MNVFSMLIDFQSQNESENFSVQLIVRISASCLKKDSLNYLIAYRPVHHLNDTFTNTS